MKRPIATEAVTKVAMKGQYVFKSKGGRPRSIVDTS
jgi:hypothetical protein